MLPAFLGGEQPLLGLTPAPIHPQTFEQRRREAQVARHLPLSVSNVENHAWAVDVADLQQAKLLRTETSGVKCGENGPVFQVARVIENASDLFGTKHGRQL